VSRRGWIGETGKVATAGAQAREEKAWCGGGHSGKGLQGIGAKVLVDGLCGEGRALTLASGLLRLGRLGRSSSRHVQWDGAGLGGWVVRGYSWCVRPQTPDALGVPLPWPNHLLGLRPQL
jgi:hypothetical protein